MLFKQPPKDFEPTAEVVGCYCECDGRILLVQRDDPGIEDRWGIVAGHVEKNEALPAAMVREMREELGLELTPERLAYVTKVYVRNDHEDWVFHMFRTSLDEAAPVVLNEENKDFSWVTPAEALSMRLVEDAAPCIEMCYNITSND